MESSAKQSGLAAGRRPRNSSPAELAEYLDNLNGKDLSQLMDSVGRGNLVQGLVLATIATVVLLLACTLVPYAMEGKSAPPKAASPPAAETQAAAAPADSQTPSPATGKPAESPLAGQPAVSKKVLGGVDEVKQSDPGSNPLENKLDDLFDKTR